MYTLNEKSIENVMGKLKTAEGIIEEINENRKRPLIESCTSERSKTEEFYTRVQRVFGSIKENSIEGIQLNPETTGSEKRVQDPIEEIREEETKVQKIEPETSKKQVEGSIEVIGEENQETKGEEAGTEKASSSQGLSYQKFMNGDQEFFWMPESEKEKLPNPNEFFDVESYLEKKEGQIEPTEVIRSSVNKEKNIKDTASNIKSKPKELFLAEIDRMDITEEEKDYIKEQYEKGNLRAVAQKMIILQIEADQSQTKELKQEKEREFKENLTLEQQIAYNKVKELIAQIESNEKTLSLYDDDTITGDHGLSMMRDGLESLKSSKDTEIQQYGLDIEYIETFEKTIAAINSSLGSLRVEKYEAEALLKEYEYDHLIGIRETEEYKSNLEIKKWIEGYQFKDSPISSWTATDIENNYKYSTYDELILLWYLYNSEKFKKWFQQEFPDLEYTRESVESYFNAGAQQIYATTGSIKCRFFVYMSEEEIEDYIYLYNTEGQASAERYAKAFEDRINQEIGLEEAIKAIDKIDSANSLLLELCTTLGIGIEDGFIGCINNIITVFNRNTTMTPTEYKASFLCQYFLMASYYIEINEETLNEMFQRGEISEDIYNELQGRGNLTRLDIDLLNGTITQEQYDELKKLPNEDPEFKEFIEELAKEDNGKIFNYAYQIGSNIGNMMPAQMAGMMTGGAGWASNLVLFLSAYGGAYKSQKRAGREELQTVLYSILSAGSEVLTEYFLGKIAFIGKEGVTVELVTEFTTRGEIFWNFIKTSGIAIFDEIKEEEIQNVLDAIFNSMINGEPLELSGQEMWDTLVITFFTTGLMNGPTNTVNLIGQNINFTKYQNQVVLTTKVNGEEVDITGRMLANFVDESGKVDIKGLYNSLGVEVHEKVENSTFGEFDIDDILRNDITMPNGTQAELRIENGEYFLDGEKIPVELYDFLKSQLEIQENVGEIVEGKNVKIRFDSSEINQDNYVAFLARLNGFDSINKYTWSSFDDLIAYSDALTDHTVDAAANASLYDGHIRIGEIYYNISMVFDNNILNHNSFFKKIHDSLAYMSNMDSRFLQAVEGARITFKENAFQDFYFLHRLEEDEVIGGFALDDKITLYLDQTHPRSIIHELTHVFDNLIGKISKSTEFKSLVQKCAEAFKNAPEFQELSGYTVDKYLAMPEEFFADSFEAYTLDRERLSYICGEDICQFFDNLLANALKLKETSKVNLSGINEMLVANKTNNSLDSITNGSATLTKSTISSIERGIKAYASRYGLSFEDASAYLKNYIIHGEPESLKYYASLAEWKVYFNISSPSLQSQQQTTNLNDTNQSQSQKDLFRRILNAFVVKEVDDTPSTFNFKDIKQKLTSILSKGKYGNLTFKTSMMQNDDSRAEYARRGNMAYLAVRNPDTFDALVRKGVNLFHGTNFSALSTILRYGVLTIDELNAKKIALTSGEYKGLNRKTIRATDFISFTDILSVAASYTNISGNRSSGFGVIVGTTETEIEKAGTLPVQYTSIVEVGSKSLPSSGIKVLMVPSSKVEYVKQMVGNRKIEVLGFDPTSNFLAAEDPYLFDMDAVFNDLRTSENKQYIDEILNIIKHSGG